LGEIGIISVEEEVTIDPAAGAFVVERLQLPRDEMEPGEEHLLGGGRVVVDEADGVGEASRLQNLDQG
jgi:hypothetical protein